MVYTTSKANNAPYVTYTPIRLATTPIGTDMSGTFGCSDAVGNGITAVQETDSARCSDGSSTTALNGIVASRSKFATLCVATLGVLVQ